MRINSTELLKKADFKIKSSITDNVRRKVYHVKYDGGYRDKKIQMGIYAQ